MLVNIIKESKLEDTINQLCVILIKDLKTTLAETFYPNDEYKNTAV